MMGNVCVAKMLTFLVLSRIAFMDIEFYHCDIQFGLVGYPYNIYP